MESKSAPDFEVDRSFATTLAKKIAMHHYHEWRNCIDSIFIHLIKVLIWEWSNLHSSVCVVRRLRIAHRFSWTSRTEPNSHPTRAATMFWLPHRVPAYTPRHHRLFCCIFVVNHSPWPCATSSGPLHTTAHPSPCHPLAITVSP